MERVMANSTRKFKGALMSFIFLEFLLLSWIIFAAVRSISFWHDQDHLLWVMYRGFVFGGLILLGVLAVIVPCYVAKNCHRLYFTMMAKLGQVASGIFLLLALEDVTYGWLVIGIASVEVGLLITILELMPKFEDDDDSARRQLKQKQEVGDSKMDSTEMNVFV